MGKETIPAARLLTVGRGAADAMVRPRLLPKCEDFQWLMFIPRPASRASPDALANIPRLVRPGFLRQAGSGGSPAAGGVRNVGSSRYLAEELLQREHILHDPQAICDYRTERADRALFIGIDTHALAKEPALASAAVEVFAANGVDIMIDKAGGYTPTPVISSHAILSYNTGARRASPTVSSSPPRTIRPRMVATNTTRRMAAAADTDVTGVVQKRANRLPRRRASRASRGCRLRQGAQIIERASL